MCITNEKFYRLLEALNTFASDVNSPTITRAINMISEAEKAKPTGGDQIIRSGDIMLDELVNNEQFRAKIIAGDLNSTQEFIRERLQQNLNFTVRVCELPGICSLPEYKTGVYARERIISSSLNDYSPRRIRLFVWEK